VLAVRLDGTLWVWGHNSEGQLGDGGITNKSSPVQITGTTWDQISAGRYFSTAIKTTGELWVWGHNGDGQLGTNNQTKYSSPVQTVSGGTNWKISKAHGRHCSAIKTDNTLWLWGWNEYGELGDGTTTHRSSPVQIAVSPNNEWVLTSGYYSTMFIEREKYNRQTNALVTKEYIIDVYPNLSNQFKSAGLWGWGDNSNGELGDGITTHRSSPIQTIAGGTNWKTGSTAYGHTAMIKTDGTLWSWGRGGSGQLGDLTRTTKSSPVQESSLNTLWKTVSCGRYHSAAVRSNGTLWSWGLGTIGQLGINANGAAASRSSPVQEVLASTLWKMVSCGSYFTAAVRTNGTLWAWGMNTNGQLGKNDVTHRSSPVQEVLANTKWKMVSSGAYHAAATRSDGTLWTWGRNTNGQLGKNDVVHRSSPVQEVTAGTTWTTVACGGYHTAGIKSDGTLWAWGQGSSGQLGDNSITSKSSPVQTLTAGTNWKQIIGGQNFSAAIKTDGTLWAWGHNDYGQLGQSDNVHRSSPIQVGTANYNWTKIMGENRAYRIMAIRDDSEDLY
jgi:alpha-tubulin suppressor-like RCC1 family protein